MNATEINWTELTWNPMSGCDKISEGCKYCYASTIAENKRGTAGFPQGFDLTLRPHKLAEPARIKRPSLIFANSMSDFFLDKVPAEYRDRIFAAIEGCSSHRFQVLTKRPETAAWYYRERGGVPANVWAGATVENGKRAAERIEWLQSTPATVRFLSVEPLLGDLGQLDLAGIHWVIVGGESGSHLMDERICADRGLVSRKVVDGRAQWTAREDRKDWVRSLRDQCRAQGVAFWFKQWGGAVGHYAGRDLDGRTWDELPIGVPGAMPEAYNHRELHLPTKTTQV